ncbi:hypothetical protein PFAG_04900 [Plasmodium falciparum Santa Lucia]|uniref:Uncharacterized protein n=6 Tax=Plasmodium falciparum TaxID=5833 RepID=A0A024W1W6_PLAFA|nr:hypothetical protein PFFVO_04448 [Plasmodium falciparum Vietnam Oak-Knoll (FVO)]ETW34510.1 hypothetical protein PFTANZ_04772 [Plasmodium falciparum Tanzania (2000708)]ETW40706.1 hypothetical protein PFNF135_05010 [Plasmodium falciparum NF135/5.C10]ETW59317.1 hypothetical protein PFMC_04794 [Plasmodium falciparum CAMP/Malaysia]EUR65250.1 hypothetical protein PFBG_04866 [Plasmodium falciparum 7G8]EUT80258.1 hypothetical protein PFAG_04900 [Plasmodium falciparum Santa Lucia]
MHIIFIRNSIVCTTYFTYITTSIYKIRIIFGCSVFKIDPQYYIINNNNNNKIKKRVSTE